MNERPEGMRCRTSAMAPLITLVAAPWAGVAVPPTDRQADRAERLARHLLRVGAAAGAPLPSTEVLPGSRPS